MRTESVEFAQSLLQQPEEVLVEAVDSGIALTSLPGNTAKIRLILDLARQISASAGPVRILDVGAGGRFNPFNVWEPFLPYRERIELTGIDVAHLDETARRAAELGFAVDLRPGHVDTIVEMFGEHTFDAVVSTQVLEHLPHWEAGLAAMTRVLRPGGVLYVTCDSGDLALPPGRRARLRAKCAFARLADRAAFVRRATGLSGDWEWAPRLDELRGAATRCGLDVESLRHYGLRELKGATTRLDVRARLLLLTMEEQLGTGDEQDFRLLYLRARHAPAS